MAKGKSVSYTVHCNECNMIIKSGKAQRPKIKELQINRFCPACRARSMDSKAKAVKKGGTKALANAK